MSILITYKISIITTQYNTNILTTTLGEQVTKLMTQKLKNIQKFRKVLKSFESGMAKNLTAKGDAGKGGRRSAAYVVYATMCATMSCLRCACEISCVPLTRV